MRMLLAALCLAACSPEPARKAPPPTAAVPMQTTPAEPAALHGSWRLAEMNGRRPAAVGDDAPAPITMTVGDFSFRAQSQCVAIWRRYEWTGDRLVVTPLNPGPVCARGLTSWENEFSRALSGVTSASRSDGLLRLSGEAGLLTFEPAPAPAREGFTGRWRLRFLHGATPPEGERPLEITVTEDAITANACVFAGWRYRQDGRLLEVTEIEAPVCERTRTPMEQRFGAFMKGLNRATIIDGGALILDSASEQLEFRRVE